jgi:anti-anti-sigma factor
MLDLHCATSKHGDMIVVEAVGDVDLASSEILWKEICGHLAPTSTVALECTRITFLDSMGLQVLMRARQYAADQQASFLLIGSSHYVDQVLALTGMVGLIPHFEDLETACVSR